MKTKEQILIEALDKFGVYYSYDEGYIDDYGVFEAIFEAMEEYRTQDRADDEIADYVLTNINGALSSMIDEMGVCEHKATTHITEDNSFPYGDKLEFDRCAACGKILNLKVL